MSRSIAVALVSNYWRDGSKDSRFPEALRFLGISQAELERCSREARGVEKGLGPVILTPTGCGKRSR